MGLASKITDKDWMRMQTIIHQEGISPYAGRSTADKINNKDKALARFTAGIKLAGYPIETFLDKISRCSYGFPFYYFWMKARELGAVPEEVEDLYTGYEIPEKYAEGNEKLKAVKDVDLNGGEKPQQGMSKSQVEDPYLTKVFMKFNRYRIPVKFKQIHLNDRYKYTARIPSGSGMNAWCSKRVSFYDITLFPGDEYSEITLRMATWNIGSSWSLLDFTPKGTGEDMGLEIRRPGMNFNEVFRCIKNYLGLSIK